MAQQRKLTDGQLAAARQEYETTPISFGALADRYGVAHSTLGNWAMRQGWVRFGQNTTLAARKAKCSDDAELLEVLTRALAGGARQLAQRRRRRRQRLEKAVLVS